MGESLFLNSHIHNFSSSHPQNQGWKVYELPSHRARKECLNLLLDFLRDVYPDSIEHRAAIKELSDEDMPCNPLPNHPADPGTEWDLSKELDSSDWFGLVHIKWGSHQIRFMSLLLMNGGGYINVHVATRSNAALRKLLAELEAYGKAKRKDEARSIFVVNGENIPLQPVSWEDIFLPPRLAESIRHNVAAFFQSEKCYRSLGIPHRRGLLFAGPPGCGKTLTLKALMYETTAKAITVLGTADVEDQHIEMAFSAAERHAPAMVVFEDLDKLVQSKNISLAHFLNIVDGFRTLSGVMLIASSNEPELLDPALLHRPSRFDRVWTFALPGVESGCPCYESADKITSRKSRCKKRPTSRTGFLWPTCRKSSSMRCLNRPTTEPFLRMNVCLRASMCSVRSGRPCPRRWTR